MSKTSCNQYEPLDYDYVPKMIEQGGEQLNLSWITQQRLSFIDFRLSSDGYFNRKDLIDFFGISTPQASLDVSHYCALAQSMNPPRSNLVYNRQRKYYTRTEDFKPCFPELSTPSFYLSNLLALGTGSLPKSVDFFGYTPALDITAIQPCLNSNISTEVLFRIIEAMHHNLAVHIVYMSVSSTDTHHLIAPHSFFNNGLYWFIRGYCYDTHDFRNFILTRVLECEAPEMAAPSDIFPDPIGNGFKEAGASKEDDQAWNDSLDLVLCANKALPARAQAVIEHEYGMAANGTIVISCRRALVFYVLKSLRLTHEDMVLPPYTREFSLLNEAEVIRRLQNE